MYSYTVQYVLHGQKMDMHAVAKKATGRQRFGSIMIFYLKGGNNAAGNNDKYISLLPAGNYI